MVSTPILAIKYSLESSRRDLLSTLGFTATLSARSRLKAALRDVVAVADVLDVRRHRRVRADAVLLHEAEQVCLGEVPRVPG